MIYYDIYESSVGPLMLTGDGQSLTGIYLENHKGGPAVGACWERNAHKFAEARKQLEAYFNGGLTQFDVPLNLQGTPFQQEVWRQLLQIPFGGTTTYGDIARRLGRSNASRAVGAAVGRNPVSIIVPCHRVLGKEGAITGYAGGVNRKAALLKLEGIESGLFVCALEDQA